MHWQILKVWAAYFKYSVVGENRKIYQRLPVSLLPNGEYLGCKVDAEDGGQSMYGCQHSETI